MKLYVNGLLYAISYALDCIERELVGVSTGHSKRVAYICAVMGKSLELNDMQLTELSACAIMHDSALTEFLTKEYGGNINLIEQINLSSHCIMGERNISKLPFSSNIKNAVLYHHENADGSGPFGKAASETPLYAQLIHFGDILDVNCNFGAQETDKYVKVFKFIDDNAGTIFDDKLCTLFKSLFDKNMIEDLQKKDLIVNLEKVVPKEYVEYSKDKIIEIMNVFARIIDYKSKFTKNHSIGVAQKALLMGEFYGYDDDKCCQLYIAGILHDIGKMAIKNEILEKPGSLTDDEFTIMKNHALFTYNILSEINGSKNIASWAASHHEKLDGTGYPFGKKAEELDHEDRLLACIDIYQALSEERPYKKGFTHEKCIEIMKDMVKSGFVDGQIVEDIEEVF
ncbi:MAG: HD domain-containing protein [Candidatus Metalachnospira sp.]|nr:HD domain-containing protein [Candidatus Metalachnospira sp.]